MAMVFDELGLEWSPNDDRIYVNGMVNSDLACSATAERFESSM